jgi:hypothetical protein
MPANADSVDPPFFGVSAPVPMTTAEQPNCLRS